jgi:hypothetical protein
MDILTAAEHLHELLTITKAVYLRCEPEVPDFTIKEEAKVVISGGGKKIELELDPKSVSSVMGLLQTSIFYTHDPEDTSPPPPRITVLTWNFKALMSYFKFFEPKPLNIGCSIVDIQVIERFMGIDKKAPENIVEAVNRSKAISMTPAWRPLYGCLHLPLMLRVLPALETTPLIHTGTRSSVFAYYDIEGQINGRLRSMKAFHKSYLPHNMGDDQKELLRPRGCDLRFLCADMRHCEVTVLQWLSGDERLKAILDSGRDLHEEIYRIVTEDDVITETKRNLSKLMFLPVMYGCGPAALGKNLGIAAEVAGELINRIRAKFPTAIKWLRSKREEAQVGPVLDFFGRPRTYTPETAYLAQNFVVQSVAATVCLEKLVELSAAVAANQICFTIHDGYGFLATHDEVAGIYKIARPILESESKLCQGLRLKAQFKYGKKLSDLVVLGK